ncbi:hypothetical protein CBL_20178 [Carabus blaptoides fortunei]
MSEGTGSRAVRNIIAAAVSALNVDEDDDFEHVVNHARRSFRPKSRSTPKGKTKWKKKILLLRRANADFCPSAAEIKYLTDCGLEKVGQGMLILLPNRDIPERVAVRHMSEERNITEVPIEATQSTNITPVLQQRITDTRITNTPTLYQDDTLDDNWDDTTSVDSVPLSLPTISSEEHVVLSFDRNNVVSNMFGYYKDPSVIDKTPIASFNNETGADAGGLTKEVPNTDHTTPQTGRGPNCTGTECNARHAFPFSPSDWLNLDTSPLLVTPERANTPSPQRDLYASRLLELVPAPEEPFSQSKKQDDTLINLPTFINVDTPNSADQLSKQIDQCDQEDQECTDDESSSAEEADEAIDQLRKLRD